MTGILTKVSNLDELLNSTKKSRPVVTIDNVTYHIGIGNEYGCSISRSEMNNNINKICISNDLTYYYVITPEYYNHEIDARYIEWLGEFKSKFKNHRNWSSFGFGRRKSPLEKYFL